MLTSNADVFRTRQAVRDLIDAVRLHRDAIARLGATGAEQQALLALADGHCKLSHPDTARAYSSLLLAAALPEDDFTAFTASTALLLASRIQGGIGDDDLYWNWDAFRDHYALATGPVRAALMNGFRVMHEMGLVTLSDGPNSNDCLFSTGNDVVERLEAKGHSDLANAILRAVRPGVAGEMWEKASSGDPSKDVIAGFRYLYERQESMAPNEPATCALIPWV